MNEPRKATSVLFIAYEYPPLGGAGVCRSLLLSKHLAEFGIDPVVLTTDLASFERDKADLVDVKLLEKIPRGLVIERIPTRPPLIPFRGKLSFWAKSMFVLTDTFASRWQPGLEKRLPALMARYKPKAIYATLPPFSMARLACSLGRKTGLPVLLDFRDAWSQAGWSPHTSWVHYRALLRVERKCLRHAAAVVCVTDQIRRDMLAAQPASDASKFRVVPNGLDGAVPAQVNDSKSDLSVKAHVIGHVGSFYYSPVNRQFLLRPWWRRKPTRWSRFSPRKEDWLYRSPYFFFRALAELFRRDPWLRTRIRVRFVGAHPQWLDEQIAEFQLQDVIECLGYLTHSECMEFQRSCDSLLITSAKVIGGEDYSISSKSFEYVAAAKPVLAIVAPGAQREFFRRSGVALMCDPDDPKATAIQISRLVSRKVKLHPDAEFLHNFTGEAIGRAIAGALHQIVSEAAVP